MTNLDLNGGIGIIEILYKSSILVLVGGGQTPKFLTNKVIIWDATKSEVIGELRYNEKVRNVKINKDK